MPATSESGRAPRARWRVAGFGAVCLICAAVAGAAVFARDDGGTGTSVETEAVSLAELREGPHAVFVDTRLGAGFGHVGVVDTAAPDQIADTELVCERVDMATDRGVCLRADRGVITTYRAVVFDDQFREVTSYDLPGTPSRARVSSDGTLGAWTTFVSGDSYLSQGLSTRTHLANLRTGEQYGDLETFTVLRDGEPFSEVDFNFWGVTFADDGNTFYATLGTGGHQFLVEGDLAAHQVTVLRDGVECPSLSPDGTRLAYKKRVTGDLGRVTWRLSVLDLATLQDHELAEERNVDDQAGWLDAETVTYGMPLSDAGTPTKETWAVPADGSGAPSLLVPGAWSLGPTER